MKMVSTRIAGAEYPPSSLSRGDNLNVGYGTSARSRTRVRMLLDATDHRGKPLQSLYRILLSVV